ncbi:MAG: hypothetical protein D6754_00430 [Alphaproteobacteria bacterium]|nr:MAG: hypothetical protein D6754_00430 [Alphaproteobacteria bacterium]
MIRIALAALALMLVATTGSARTLESRKYGTWLYEYVAFSGWRACQASRNYSNATFRIRFVNNRMDVIFRRNDFRYRWNARVGTSRIRVGGRTYRLATVTPRRSGSRYARSRTLIMTVRDRDYRSFFNAVKRARNLRVTVPGGRTFPVDLRGSARALNRALRCWQTRRTGG